MTRPRLSMQALAVLSNIGNTLATEHIEADDIVALREKAEVWACEILILLRRFDTRLHAQSFWHENNWKTYSWGNVVLSLAITKQ